MLERHECAEACVRSPPRHRGLAPSTVMEVAARPTKSRSPHRVRARPPLQSLGEPAGEQTSLLSEHRAPMIAAAMEAGWQWVGRGEELLFYNATTGQTSLEIPAEIATAAEVDAAGSPISPRAAHRSVDASSRARSTDADADGLLAFLLATSPRGVPAVASRRDGAAPAAAHPPAPAQPACVRMPAPSTDPPLAVDGLRADGLPMLVPRVDELTPRAPRNSAEDLTLLIATNRDAQPAHDAPSPPRSPAPPRAAQGAAGVVPATTSTLPLPPSCHGPIAPSSVAQSTRLPRVRVPLVTTQQRAAQHGAVQLVGRPRSPPTKGPHPPAWDFDHLKLQLLDAASVHCDRSFDSWERVRLETPSPRGRLPKQADSHRSFYSEGLHRSPRPQHQLSPRAHKPSNAERASPPPVDVAAHGQ
jgi:hypothetical protein